MWLSILPVILALSPQGASPQAGAVRPAQASAREGHLQLSLSSRIFSTPLFGPRSTGAYRVRGAQRLRDRGNLAFWYGSGFPNYTSYLGFQWNDIPFRTGLARLTAGDISLTPLRSVSLGSLREAYPVRGVSFRQVETNSSWNVFAGRARRTRQLPGREDPDPFLFGGGYQRSRGFNHYGLSLLTVVRPIYVDEESGGGPAAVLAADFHREISPFTTFFAQISTSQRGGVGGRSGFRLGNEFGDLTAAVYSFSNEFPFLDPLYRPGERGIELGGRYEVTDFATMFGLVDYVADSEVDDQVRWRGEIGFDWDLGFGRPNLRASYSHNETIYDPLSIAEPGSIVDRYALSLQKAYSYGFYALSLEHLNNFSESELDRSQVTFDFRRSFGHRRNFVEGSTVAQWQAGDSFGVTSEAILERALGGRYSYRVGGGVAFLNDSDVLRGEGVVRAGLGRSIGDSGWWARVEVTKPFPIGLERSQVSRDGLVFELGYRLGWNDRANTFNRAGSTAGSGTIVGRISAVGLDPEGLPILVNGRNAARASADGTFRVKKAPTGTVIVSPDLRGLDPRLGVLGGPSRQVEIDDDETVTIEFQIRPMSYFQGALVVCRAQKVRPAVGVSLLLEGDGYRRTVITNRVGGFQFASIPPGPYRLIVMDDSFDWPPSVDLPLIWKLDLNNDLPGHIIRVNCGDTGASQQEPKSRARGRLKERKQEPEIAAGGPAFSTRGPRIGNRGPEVESQPTFLRRLVDELVDSSPITPRSPARRLVATPRSLDVRHVGFRPGEKPPYPGIRPASMTAEVPLFENRVKTEQPDRVLSVLSEISTSDPSPSPGKHPLRQVDSGESSDYQVDHEPRSRPSRRPTGTGDVLNLSQEQAFAADLVLRSRVRVPTGHFARRATLETVVSGCIGLPEWNRMRRGLSQNSRGPPRRSSRDPPDRGQGGNPISPATCDLRLEA